MFSVDIKYLESSSFFIVLQCAKNYSFFKTINYTFIAIFPMTTAFVCQQRKTGGSETFALSFIISPKGVILYSVTI